jgi:hypothetical protein
MADTKKHENLAAALAAFQTEIPTVVKGATAKVKTKSGADYQYSYADLAVITPLVLPLLGKNGLAWSSQPTLMGDHFVLHYSLSHESGEQIEGVYPLPSPNTPPQELGSAITYARRYALCAVTGVAPGGDDDDAQSAPAAPVRQQRARRAPEPTPAPAPVPVAEKDWAAEIGSAQIVSDLRAVHAAAEQEGQLGFALNPQHRGTLNAVVERLQMPVPPADAVVTVGQLINLVKPTLPAEAPTDEPPAQPAGEPAADWAVAEIPTGDAPAPSGEEPF